MAPRQQWVEKMAVAVAKEHLVSKGVELVQAEAVGEGFQLVYVDDGTLVFADVVGAQGLMPAPPAEDDEEAVLESLRTMRPRDQSCALRRDNGRASRDRRWGRRDSSLC